MTSQAPASSTRSATPLGTLLVAIIVAQLVQVAGTVFELFMLPETFRYLSDEFDASIETASSVTRMVLLANVTYLVMAVLILLVAIIVLVRLIRSGRSVRWGIALLIGSLASIPVGAAIFLAQSPAARAVAGIES